jgi:hypothetical protein
MSDFNRTEDEWWIENPKRYASFNELPSKVKWLARQVTNNSSQSQRSLEVYVDDQKRLLSGNYIAPLMLLNIQELSCMAESFSPTENSLTVTRFWRNIYFVWRLRESILERDEEKINPFLERWTIRLINGFSNSKSKRREHDEKIGTLYNAYREAGALERGEFVFDRLLLKSDSSNLALLAWVLKNQRILVEAAQRIVDVVLCGHIRISSAETGQFATRMITDIIDQLRVDQSIGLVVEKKPSQGTHPKRPRGRPRKQEVPPPSKDDTGNGHRTRSMTAGLSGVSVLLAGPAFTPSPVKSPQKV